MVSGVTALGAAVDLRAWVAIEELPGRVEIDASDLQLKVDGFRLDPSKKTITAVGSSSEAVVGSRYVSAVMSELDAKDIRATVRSGIPPGAGLGSSAAIVVAAVGALNEHFGHGLSLNEIASLSHRIERQVQKGLGSPLDTALSCFGGYQMVSVDAKPLDLPELVMVVGFTGLSHETRAEVAKVQALRELYPDIVNPIFQAVGCISARAVQVIRDHRLEELGRLMNINHGLLEAIGVGTRELSELVYASRVAGKALGAKLTGAGGGGCIIALPSPNNKEILATAITQARGRAFTVKTGCEGLRIEA